MSFQLKKQGPGLLALLMLMSCTTGKNQEVVQTENGLEQGRDIAMANPGMQYPSNYSFRMQDHRGQTYITFLKQKLKPALDSLGDRRNGGGGGFKNIGSAGFKANYKHIDPRVMVKYKGAKWDRATNSYKGDLPDQVVANVYDNLLKVKPVSTVDSLSYYDRADKFWYTKNDMAIALKDIKVDANPFDLATLYALTGGLGVKFMIDENNYNYHVMYLTGKTNPHVQVMSGRSFASSPGRGVGDATDPEYLRDLSKFLKSTPDTKTFYRALIMAIADTNPAGWKEVSPFGQTVLSDFLTVYTAEAVRHLMVNLQNGMHPWEIDLAAVTVVSAVSSKLNAVVTGGRLVQADLGAWFAPSPNNVAGGPQRSGIGITRKDRKIFQKAIHAYEMTQPDGKKLILEMQKIVGSRYNGDDVIQATFEYLSNVQTPAKLGPHALALGNAMAMFIELAAQDAQAIAALLPK